MSSSRQLALHKTNTTIAGWERGSVNTPVEPCFVLFLGYTSALSSKSPGVPCVISRDSKLFFQFFCFFLFFHFFSNPTNRPHLITHLSPFLSTSTPPQMGGNGTADDTSRFQRRMKRKVSNILALEARVLVKREEVRASVIQHHRANDNNTELSPFSVKH